MAKVTCATCGREEKGFCIKKKSRVAKNKRRRCDQYLFAVEKVTERQIIKTVKLPYTEQQRIKAELKKLRALERANKNNAIKGDVRTADPKHPITGDLSRFKTTASE
jgi:hypothetical protein